MIFLPRILSQRDPQWKGLTLGTSGLSIGDWGCTLISCIMAAQAFGRNLEVEDVLSRMNQKGGFSAGGSLNWLIIAEVLGVDFGYRWETDADPTNRFERVKEIDGFRHIERLATVFGIPTVVFVDTNHDARPNHWVVYIGSGMVVDPWDGQTKPLAVFERLYGYAIFTGTPILIEGEKVPSMIGKANEIAHGRNVDLNTKEIMNAVIRP